MQSDPKFTHRHDHDHVHAHPPTGSQVVSESQRDLISPVLSGVWQRVWWSSLFLGALWLLVFWALHSNG